MSWRGSFLIILSIIILIRSFVLAVVVSSEDPPSRENDFVVHDFVNRFATQEILSVKKCWIFGRLILFCRTCDLAPFLNRRPANE